MANNSPTIVAASLSDDQLKKSIDSLVTHVDEAMKKMVQSTNNAVGEMEAKLKSLGNLKIDSGVSADGGASKRTKAQNAETDAVEKNIAARDKQIKKNQDAIMSFDQMAKAQQVAIRSANPSDIRNADTLQTMNIQLDLLRERLREARQQYSSFVALAAHATTTGDKGLFQYATDGVHRYEQEVRNLIPQIRTLQSGIQQMGDVIAPQGHTIQNYVNSLQKANPELAALNAQYKSGTSLLQENTTAITQNVQAQQKEISLTNEQQTKLIQLQERLKQIADERKAASQVLQDAGWTRFGLKIQSGAYPNDKDLAEKLAIAEKNYADAQVRVNALKNEQAQIEKEILSIQNSASQNTQRQTEEIRKQAQAIRESQQWKEKGFITADGSVLSNQENVAKKKRISLEEQILNLQQQGIFLSQDQTSREWQLVDASGKRIAVIQKENENLATQRERVAEISSEVRRMFTENNFGRISFTPAPLSGVRYIYQENDERSKGLTIEQQVEKILKEQSAEYERQASIKKASNNGSQRTLNELQSQARAIEELLEKGKRVKALGGFEFIPADMSGLTVMQQILSYQEQRKSGLLAENQALNLQLELSNAIAQAQEKITQEQEKTKKKYVSPTVNDDYYQNLRNAIANKLGVDTSKVINADAQYDSVKRLSGALKQLQDAYTRMTNEERNSPIGKQMLRQMQELEWQTQQLRKEMSRPVSLKDALGGSEKTLDDIAHKIQRLQSYKRGLDLADPKQVAELNQIDAAINRLNGDLNKYMGTTKQATEINKALGRSWNYMKNRLAFYFTVGASTQFVRNLIEVRSQYEMNERALGILIDSAERGTQIFNELSQMALVSPYTLIELSTAAKQLTAYDVAAKDVVDTTRRLADMTAAVGIPIERLTYALGQIKAYGYLNARDARMFSNAGIPLIKQLSEYYTELEGRLVSTADVYDRIKKKSIDYDEVMNVIMKMTDEGGKFFGFQAKMAETLKVQLANLTLAWNNMLNEIGKSNQGLLSGGIVALKTLFLHWKDIDKIIYDVAISFGVLYAAMALSNLMFGKGTLAAIKNVAAMEGVTAANYKSVLSTAKLKASQAQFLVALNKTNVALRSQMVMMRTLSLAQAESAAKANILKTAWLGVMAAMETASAGIAAIGAAIASIAPQIAIFAAIGAIVDFGQTVKERADAIKEYNETLVRNTKESVDSINKYLGSLLYENASELSVGDQEKAWERVREEIELSTAASELYLSTLASGNSESERINKANDLLKRISEIRGLMSEWHKEDIKITQDFHVLGIGGDGLTKDLNDFLDSYHKALESSKDGISININETNGLAESWERVVRSISEYGEFFLHGANIPIIKQISEAVSAIAPPAWMQKYLFGGELWGMEFKGLLSSNKASAQIDMNELNDEVDEFVESLKERLDRSKVDDPLKIREALQESLKSAGYTGEQLEVLSIISAKKLRNLYKDTYESMSEDGKAEFDKFLSSESTSIEAFFNFVKHRNSSLLSGITNEEIANGKWLTDERKKWLQTYLDEFLKTHAYAYDDLANMVNNMNKLAVYIPVFFQMAQTPSDVARDYESRTGIRFSTNPVVKDAKSQVEIIDKLQKAQEDAQKKYDAAQKAGGAYWENNKKTLKEENEALIAQIHSYNALTKAEESANKKGSRGGGSKKDQLLDALKQEISLVEKLQGDYDKLTKSSASQAEALETIRGAYGKTIRLLNVQLGKYGLPQLEISQLITGKDPHKALEHFKQTLDTLVSKGLLTLERSKEIEAVIEKLTLSAKTYDLDMITKGLNSELDKLKDEYELAVELDANPELGGMFADYMGINLDELPKNAEEAAKKAQQYIDKILRENKSKEKIDISSLMGKDAFDKWIKSSGHSTEDGIVKVVDNYRQALHKMQVDESKKQMKEWDKLLEKYAEYEYKVTQIQREAERERETARKKGASQEILDAIDERERQELAKLSFEEFQKSPEWIVATGDLANMSKSAIGMLIEQLEKYKRSAKNLSPKQIKQLNSALSKLYKEQRKNNPFKAISNMLDEAKERMATFDEDINKTQKEIDNLTKKKKENIVEGVADEETDNKLKKAIERLKELKKAREETGEVDASSWVSSINETISAVQSAIGVFDDLAKAIGGVENSDLDKVFSVIDKAGQGAAIGAQIGGGYGAIIGAVAGAVTGLISIFAGAANERITAKVEESERAVKRLELAYIDLEHAVNEAYGMATIGANMAAKANKELQLVELKRQLTLERSRDSKDRDEDKIIDLQKQIKELEYDIADTTDNIVNDLLGISSVGDAMENLMDGFIEALRSGEDAMATFDESVDEMIANMVKKMFTTKILQPWFEEQWNKIQAQINERAGKLPDELAKVQSSVSNARMADLDDNDSLVGALRALGMSDDQIHLLNWYNEFGEYDWGAGRNARLRAAYEKMLKEAEQKEAELQKELTTATMPTTDDIRQYAELLRSGKPIMEENMQEVANFLRELGLMKDDANKNLSALQQGIQGITEDTAGALEAYMNGVSQQVYLHSDLLTQIRDAVVGFDMDVQTATMGEILLQLRSSYEVQMAIHGILEGVLTPSGRSFSVELVS